MKTTDEKSALRYESPETEVIVISSSTILYNSNEEWGEEEE